MKKKKKSLHLYIQGMCLNPIYAQDCGTKYNGKRLLKFLPHNPLKRGDYEELKKIYGRSLVMIPCGHCSECTRAYSKQWAVRCMLESLYHDEMCFVTLTYDNAHLPKTTYVYDEVTGEVKNKVVAPLVKRDLQLFIKRLRKMYPDKHIRYFGCGEYGSEGLKYGLTYGRPHYHLILFGIDFAEDRKPSNIVGSNELKQQVFRSTSLEKLWTYGISSFGDVTPESCSYVARYSLKKKITFENDGSFLCMSTSPGIGAQFFLDKKDVVYLSDRVYSSKFHGVSVPRYFDKLAEKDPQICTLFRNCKDKRLARASDRVYTALYTTGSTSVEEAWLKTEIKNWTRALRLLRR